MIPQSTAEHYRQQQRLAVATVAAMRRAWSGMTRDFDGSWTSVGPRLVTVAVSAQLGAARQGAAYLPRVLEETDQPDDPAGAVNVAALVGTTADGRSLDGLLYGAVTTSKTASSGAVAPADALAVGGRWLDMVAASLVADAARDAVGVGIAARPQITGYVRMLNTPSCARCVVLAGKWFKWNQGFLRHPRCDCRHIPASENRAGDFRTDPRAAIETGRVNGLSRADRQAIEDGADVGQVINARRGMRDVRMAQRDLKITTEGTTTRGVAGRALADQGLVRLDGSRYRSARTPRLRPESIYALAEDRDDAIRLLKRFGYLSA